MRAGYGPLVGLTAVDLPSTDVRTQQSVAVFLAKMVVGSRIV